MTSSRFDLGSTSKTLNLSLLRFNERSGSENLACYMEGEVWEWFHDAELLGLCTNWAHFICAQQDRFGAPILDESMETTTQESKV